MPVIHTRYYTDPACPWSWALEPALRRLLYDVGDRLEVEYVMSGMGSELDDPSALAVQALEAAARSGMPVDARGWLINAPRSSHPACIALLAAAEQGDSDKAATYLRRLREGFFCRRRKLDSADALVSEAQSVPGLDLARFRLDLQSNAMLERFGAHLERARSVDAQHHAESTARVKLPSLEFRGPDGELHGVYGFAEFDSLSAAAAAAGASPPESSPPTIGQALARFGAMSTAEIAAVCRLPGPRAPAQLWQLAAEWQIKVEQVLGGELWSLA